MSRGGDGPHRVQRRPVRLMGYAYGADVLYGPPKLHPDRAERGPSPSSLLSSAVLFVRNERGMVGMLTSETAGGVLARRLFPAVLLIPLDFGGYVCRAIARRSSASTRHRDADVRVGIGIRRARLVDRRSSAVRAHLERIRADRALVHSEARFRGILEARLDCIISMDEKGRVIEWNPAAEAVLRLHPGRSGGQGYGGVDHPTVVCGRAHRKGPGPLPRHRQRPGPGKADRAFPRSGRTGSEFPGRGWQSCSRLFRVPTSSRANCATSPERRHAEGNAGKAGRDH
jgi:PAS domain-containing protein